MTTPTDPATLLDAAAARLRDALAAPDWCDRLEACGLVDRDVALALADWLDRIARGIRDNVHVDSVIGKYGGYAEALDVARAILGPGWAFQQAAREPPCGSAHSEGRTCSLPNGHDGMHSNRTWQWAGER